MLRLGGNVLSMENASESSSATKGETIEDTIRIVDNYSDAIVMRHPEAGAAARAATVSEVPIINGGDGAGQHPTQAFLDLYTIAREIGRTDDFHVAFVGDLKYGRAARSLAYLLGKYDNVRIDETEDIKRAMEIADVVYQTRVQKERFPSQEEYLKFKGAYVIDRSMVDHMK